MKKRLNILSILLFVSNLVTAGISLRPDAANMTERVNECVAKYEHIENKVVEMLQKQRRDEGVLAFLSAGVVAAHFIAVRKMGAPKIIYLPMVMYATFFMDHIKNCYNCNNCLQNVQREFQ